MLLRSRAKLQGQLTCHSLSLVQWWEYSAPDLVDGKAVCLVMHLEADLNLLNLNLWNCCRCWQCRCQPCHRHQCQMCWLELAPAETLFLTKPPIPVCPSVGIELYQTPKSAGVRQLRFDF